MSDAENFPQKLMNILSDPSNEEAITWLPNGRSFVIRNRKLFAEKVMPKFFPRKAKYSSFTRKLNRWNFTRVSNGPEIGTYYHEFFLRDKPHLAAQMFCKSSRTIHAMTEWEEEQKAAPEKQGNLPENLDLTPAQHKPHQHHCAMRRIDADTHTNGFPGFMPMPVYPGHLYIHPEPSQMAHIPPLTTKDPSRKILTYSEIMESHRRQQAQQKRNFSNSATAA